MPAVTRESARKRGEIAVGLALVAAVGIAGGEQRALERALLADAHATVFQVRAAAALGGEYFLSHGIVDDPDLEPAALLDRDRHAKTGNSVQKIGGAVERIDDPDGLVARRCGRFPRPGWRDQDSACE